MDFFSGFEYKLAYVVVVVTTTLIAAAILYSKVVAQPIKRLPPGSCGFPVIGETISFLRACIHDEIHEWVQVRVDKFGPMFKTSLLGRKTMFLTGQAGNKFTLVNSSNALATDQFPHLVQLFGKDGVLQVSGSKHKLLRSVITSAFSPESLQKYVNQVDWIVKELIFQELHGKDSSKMVPFMKKMSFTVSCGLLLGISDVKEKDLLHDYFKILMKGTSSVAINFPGTAFYKALKARGRINYILSDVIRRTKEEIENGKLGEDKNSIISGFLNLRDENGDHLSEEAIMDNLVNLISASYDTVAVLLCSFIKKLATSSEVYDKILQEQNEVLNASKERDGKLTWSQIQMMKYTWRVAQELMRLTPPVFGSPRFVEMDSTFSGFDIPKGWNVFWVASPTHLDKDIFDKPKSFDPSRFESESKSSIPPYTYIPFGGGQKICPGSEFARIEVLVVIHYLVTNYSWSQMISDEPIKVNPMPFPAMGLPVKLTHKQA